MKILLLTPPFDLMKKGYGSKRKVRAGFFPPLALGYLAAPLVKKGYVVKIIDSAPMNYQNSDILEEVKQFAPDLIGLSTVTADAEEAYSLINNLKDNYPQIPVVFGGPHANCFPELVFKNAPKLEVLVHGEGEKIFEEIVDYYRQTGGMPKNVLGTWVNLTGGSVKKNQPAQPIMDLDKILPPTHQLYNYKLYRPLPLQYKRLPVANLITSRGCPYGRCTFCFESGRASQRYRRHSPKRMIEEIKFLIKTHNIREVAFWDDNFLINENWTSDFCNLLDKEGVKIPWSACARVNTVTEKMLKRASRSGLWNIFYGVESGNQDLLERIKKGITLEQVEKAVGWANKHNIDTRGSFMLALPGETPQKAKKTIDFACQIELTYAQFLPTHPEWGTELYDDAVLSGRVVPMYQGRTTPTYVPDGYRDEEEVRRMLKLAYRKFYFRPSYIIKHIKRLKDIDKIKQYFDALMYIIGVST